MAYLDDQTTMKFVKQLLTQSNQGEEKTLPGLGVIFEILGMEVTILKRNDCLTCH